MAAKNQERSPVLDTKEFVDEVRRIWEEVENAKPQTIEVPRFVIPNWPHIEVRIKFGPWIVRVPTPDQRRWRYLFSFRWQVEIDREGGIRIESFGAKYHFQSESAYSHDRVCVLIIFNRMKKRLMRKVRREVKKMKKNNLFETQVQNAEIIACVKKAAHPFIDSMVGDELEK